MKDADVNKEGNRFRSYSVARDRCGDQIDVLQLSLSRHVGQEYFNEAVQHLNHLTDADYTLIGLINADETTITTVAICNRGELVPNITYSLKGSPCEEATLKGSCLVPDVMKRFPEDKLLSDLQISTYLGISIADSSARPMGIVASLFKSPVQDYDEVRVAFDFFAARIQGEMERMRMVDALNCQEELHRFALKAGNFGVYQWSVDRDEGIFNDRLYEIIEYTKDELPASYSNWMKLIHPEDKVRIEETVRQLAERNQNVTAPTVYRIKTKSGNYKWIKSERYVLERSNNNQRVRIVGIISEIDKEVQTEQRLRESLANELKLNKELVSKEKRYAFALKAGNLGVFDWNVVTNSYSVNNYLKEMFGSKVGADFGRFDILPHVIHPEDLERIQQSYWMVSQDNKVNPVDVFRLKIQQQGYRWVEVQSQAAEWDEDGKIVRVIGIIRDIDAIKKAEDVLKQSYVSQIEFNERLKKREEELLESQGKLLAQMTMQRKLHKELKESENRWAYALEGNGDGVWDWDMESNSCFLSGKARDLLQVNHVRNFHDIIQLIHPAQMHEFQIQVTLSTSSPFDPFHAEVQIGDWNGKYKWVLIRGKVVEYELDIPKRMVGTIADLSSIKRIQKELAIYEEMIKQNQSAILFTSLHGIVEFCNDTVLEQLGYQQHEIVGKSLGNLVPDKSFEHLLANNYQAEQVWVAKNNQTITTQLLVSKIQDENEPLGFVFNSMDITENKRLKDELTILAMEKLENELLVQRKQTEMMIEVQENEKSFLARELHDGVGQMMSLIKLQLEQLQGQVAREDVENRCKNILELVQHVTSDIKGLTNELMPLSLRNIGLESAITSLLDKYAQLTNNRLSISCRINLNGYKPGEKISIHIYRIAQEAVNNAIKYSRATSLSIIIMKLKNTVNILIEDNGCGFDVETEIKKPNSYGLKTMKERAKLIHGRLLFSSAVNTGTTVSLTIPVNQEL